MSTYKVKDNNISCQKDLKYMRLKKTSANTMLTDIKDFTTNPIDAENSQLHKTTKKNVYP
jgi:hypothetical protein